MVKNHVPAPRSARVQHRVPAHKAALAWHRASGIIRVRRRHAMRHATTCGGIMNDAL